MPRNRLQRGAASAGDADDSGPRGAGKARDVAVRTTFADWLAADGAPWRPFDDEGVLIAARPRPARSRQATVSPFDKASERQLVRHLKAACLWPARDRDKTWRLGDYSSYALQFAQPGRVPVRLQFWSEPDGRTSSSTVSLAVSAAESDAAAPAAPLDAASQERLRDHGFEVARRGRAQGRFAKEVLLPGGRAVRALARETIAILCKALDYDGAGPLEFRLHLGTRLSAGFTFDGVCAHDLAKLMLRWGYMTAEVEERAGHATIIKSAVEEQPFLVAFVGERNADNGAYGMIGLRTFLRFEDGVPAGLTNAINNNFATVKASVDEDGDLVVQAPIILHGGVTSQNLEMWFKVWRETLLEIGAGFEWSGDRRRTTARRRSTHSSEAVTFAARARARWCTFTSRPRWGAADGCMKPMKIQQLIEAARRGDRDAAWQLGDCYREAVHGLSYSPRTAYRWYAESALGGSPTGQNNLGAAYENGFGCRQSYTLAAKWYRQAATQGMGVAMANLAFLHLNGYGTRRDKAEALRWFQRGAAAGCRKSKRMLEAVRGEP